MKLKGGSLKVKEIKAFLEASYEDDPPKEIMGYKLDEKLSFLYGKVYVNHKSKKVVVAHRGTVETIDWANNALYALSSLAYKLTPRYQQGLKMQNDAHKKYKGYQFETLGHSQGGLLAHLLSDKSKNGYLVNPAYKKEQLRDNEYVIRSSGDIVSKLSVPRKYLNALLYPSWSKNHYITIPAKTSNPITEHKPDILDRLDPERSIGRGAGFGKRPLKGYTINDEMSGGCHCDEMKGGARASNPWVEHVKKYAKENNMTYACAIPEAKKTYIKVDKNAKKKEMMEVLKNKWRSDINKNFTTVLRANPESLPSLRLKFKTRNKGYREYMQQVAPKMYIKLTEKMERVINVHFTNI